MYFEYYGPEVKMPDKQPIEKQFDSIRELAGGRASATGQFTATSRPERSRPLLWAGL